MDEKYVELGQVYEDDITGLQGVATGLCIYLFGCRQVQLTPMAAGSLAGHGKPSWIDEQRLLHTEVGNRHRGEDGQVSYTATQPVHFHAVAGGPQDSPSGASHPA